MGIQIDASSMTSAANALNIVSTNISNSTTVGYKGASFQDILGSTAGVNPNGLLAGESQNFSQGQISSTTNTLNMAINGNGFFNIVNSQGVSAYTRDGAFSTNNTGQIVDAQGDQLMGYPAINGILAPSGTTLAPLTMPMQSASTTMTTNLVLDTSTTVGSDLSTTFPVGSSSTSAVAAAPATSPASTVAGQGGATSTSLTGYNYATTSTVFAADGTSTQVNLYVAYDTAASASVANGGTGIPTWDIYAVSGGSTPLTNAAGTALAPNATITLNTTTGAFNPPSYNVLNATGTAITGATTTSATTIPGTTGVTLSLSNLTAGSAFSSDITVDGGALASTNVNTQGVISAVYGSGNPITIGQVMLSTFNNPNGLQPIGVTGTGNQWIATAASGSANLVSPGSGAAGAIIGSSTEDSNSDLTTDLINLISAQRDFQAASDVVQTDGQVLQTTVQLVQNA